MKRRDWSSLIEGTPAYEAYHAARIAIKIGNGFTLTYNNITDEIILAYNGFLWFYYPKKTMTQKWKDILYGDKAICLKAAEKELRRYQNCSPLGAM